jgi:hypothetical protein
MKVRVLTFLVPLGIFPAIAQQTSPVVSPVPETVVVVGTPEPVTAGEPPGSVVVMDTQEHPLAFETVEDYLRTVWLHPYLRMDNLSNTGYQEIAGVPMPGRSFVGGVEISLARAHQ